MWVHHLLLWHFHQCRNGSIICHNKSTNTDIETFNGRRGDWCMGLGFFGFVFLKSSFVVSALSWKFNAAGCKTEIQWCTIWAVVALGFDFHLRSRFLLRLILVFSLWLLFQELLLLLLTKLALQLWSVARPVTFFNKHLPIITELLLQQNIQLPSWWNYTPRFGLSIFPGRKVPQKNSNEEETQHSLDIEICSKVQDTICKEFHVRILRLS